jgi:hypothetical protein
VPLRILIDEDLSPTIAQGLWRLGYDATSVRDRGRLGMKDWELLPWLVQERLTICTDNGQEWAKRMEDWQSSGKNHYGLLVVDQRWGSQGILRALERYLGTDAPDSLINQVVFVEPPEP